MEEKTIALLAEMGHNVAAICAPRPVGGRGVYHGPVRTFLPGDGFC